MKNYETEARERWGDTDAYRKHEQKTKNNTKEKWAEANDGSMASFADFAACKNSGESADSVEAQTLVVKLQTLLPQTITSAWMRLSQVLEKCKLLTSGSRRMLTSMVKEPPYLLRKL